MKSETSPFSRWMEREGLTQWIEKSILALTSSKFYEEYSVMSDEKTIPSPGVPATPETKIPTHYTKSNFFRVIHCDGAWGGSTPSCGDLMITFYSHRIPFPGRITLDGKGNEIVGERVVNSGIERELEASIVMNLTVAKSLHQWLGERIKHVEQQSQQSTKIQ